MDATELEKKYQNLLESYNIPYSPHITRFIEKLKQKEPDLNDHTLRRKKYLSFKKQTSVEADELLRPNTVLDMMTKLAKYIRSKMTNIKHTFDGSFENSFNEKSVPEELLIFVKLLVSGNSNELDTGFFLTCEYHIATDIV